MDADTTGTAAGRQSRRSFLRLVGVGVAGSLLAACQQAAAPAAKPAAQPTTPAAKPAAAPTTAPAAAKPAATTAPAAAAKPVDAAGDMAAIEAAAKKEGEVVLYSSLNIEDAENILPVFEKRYGIKVNHVRAGSEKIVQRLVTEAKGGKVLADVLESNGLDWLQVLNDDLIAPFQPPEAQALPADLKSAKNLWYTSRVNQIVIMCNTKKVPDTECHKLTFESLADPKWKGEILIEEGDVEWLMALAKRKYKSEEKAIELFKKIAANNPSLHKGHTETAELLVAGKGSLFATAYLHRVFKLMEKGAPADWAPNEGVLQQQLIGVVKGAPHPNAAKLFTNWFLSEQGAKAIADVGRVPGRQGMALGHEFFPKGTNWYPQEPEDAAEMQKFQKLWNEIFGLRG